MSIQTNFFFEVDQNYYNNYILALIRFFTKIRIYKQKVVYLFPLRLNVDMKSKQQLSSRIPNLLDSIIRSIMEFMYFVPSSYFVIYEFY